MDERLGGGLEGRGCEFLYKGGGGGVIEVFLRDYKIEIGLVVDKFDFFFFWVF